MLRCRVGCLVALASAMILIGSSGVFAQQSKAEKKKAADIAAIKKLLSYKGDKKTTWYVIQLETTSSTRTSVEIKTVQGQDQAADLVYEFMSKSGGSGTKYFPSASFPGTEKGKAQMDEYVRKLLLAGKMNGFRPKDP